MQRDSDTTLDRSEEEREITVLREGVKEILNERIELEGGRLVDVSLEPLDESYLVHITLYDYSRIGSEEVANYEKLLNAEFETPMRVLATILASRLTDSSGEVLVVPSPVP